MSEDADPLCDFGGAVRLFPLPNLVLFPHVVQPLHIFEPRYRELLSDALADDRLMGLALLRPGWEEDYHKRPPIHPIICVGRILQEERLADGRFNLLLHGLSRARVTSELKIHKPYRTARVQLLPDVAIADPGRAEHWRRRLGQRLSQWFAAHPTALSQMRRLLESPLALGALSDILAFSVPLEPEVKQELLGEVDVESRVRRLLELLENVPAFGKSPPPATKGEARKFPPEFSTN
jgi:Lon protease-like protein